MAASALPDPVASSPYQLILGEAFASLHAHVQRAHLAPLAGRGQHVRLEVTAIGADVEWVRRIGSSSRWRMARFSTASRRSVLRASCFRPL
jgi:hypothetical protein